MLSAFWRLAMRALRLVATSNEIAHLPLPLGTVPISAS